MGLISETKSTGEKVTSRDIKQGVELFNNIANILAKVMENLLAKMFRFNKFLEG